MKVCGQMESSITMDATSSVMGTTMKDSEIWESSQAMGSSCLSVFLINMRVNGKMIYKMVTALSIGLTVRHIKENS